jgi:integrase
MPAKQRGTVIKRGPGNWQARYRDEDGQQRGQSGFDTKTEAREWLDGKLPEVAALRRGEMAALRRRTPPTLGELVEEFLAQHNAEKNTLRGLRERPVYATKGPKRNGGEGSFRDVRIDRLDPTEIGAWRRRLPERSAWGIHKALRQVLNYAVRIKLLDENVAALVPNPEPKRREVEAFDSLDALDALGEELSERWQQLPVFVALTGLRPEEWIALERRDVDRTAGVVHVRRVFTAGEVKLVGKNSRSLRAVPLPARALEAVDAIPARLDTRLLFPARRGGYLNLDTWRGREWTPALRAAGLAQRGPYALRHTYATWSIAAGVELYTLARFMGTSVGQIDKTYGHLLPDAIERTRSRLDVFVGSFPERSRMAEDSD